MSSQPRWKFTTFKESAVITTASAASMTVYAAGLAAIFNPWILAAAGAYVGFKAVPIIAARFIPAVRRHIVKRFSKSKNAARPDVNSEINGIVAKLSAKLKMKEAPPVILLNKKFVAIIALPFGLRWLMNNERMQQSVMPSIFAAEPNTRTFMATRESLRKITGDQLAWVTAHEMSHMQQDRLSPAILARMTLIHSRRLLLVGIGTGVALSALSIPAVAVLGTSTLVGVVGLLATHMAATLINNVSARVMERRADRNALFLHGDLNAAEAALETVYGEEFEDARRASAIKEAFASHPTLVPRIESLRTAFAKVAAHPAFVAPVPSAAPAQADIQQAAPQLEWDSAATLQRSQKR